jgi:ATP-dependent RNA helicase DeaD
MESIISDRSPNSDLLPPVDRNTSPVTDSVNPAANGVPFRDLRLIQPLLDAVSHAGYTNCTPVQAAVIPPAMRGQDVIGQAQTGTGKTAAFLVPFLNRWRPHKTKGPIGLVMLPTRELASQVAEEAEKLAPSSQFRTIAVYGGTGMQRQLTGLSKGCDLVVGTPGRIIDHLRRGTLTLDHVRYVVLDEADRMLDIGFRPDIERILRRCPEQRQTLLMSATVPDEIKRLVNRYMKDPLHLNLSPTTLTVDKIRQTYITVDKEKKFDLLLKVIDREKPRQCIIFVERKRWADDLLRKMKPLVPRTYAIHGDLPQGQREKIMAGFKSGKVTYLIATDVASRGIDVNGISHVINYDLPADIENYVHRIGRTGRIGKDGVAIAFVTPEEGSHLTEIEITINRLIEADFIDGFEASAPKRRRHVDDPDEPAPAPTEAELAEPKKAVFGKFKKKYSSRL